MKALFSKLNSRKLATTVGAWALGVYLIKSGSIVEGVGLITGAQASYNVGQGIADGRATDS